MSRRLALQVFVFAVMLITLAFSCSQPKGPDDAFTDISGVVTDSVSGAAIESAAIYLDDTVSIGGRVYTDTAGWYGTSGLGGSFRVFCLKAGFNSKWCDVKEAPGSLGIDSVNFALSRSQ
ncbi:MAG TPA: hypothetical protein VN285_07790 [Candidatus Deferrimicrobium sp.]|nr:hypothetical protein [Candidatus Deferrimicrobium sp.]